MRVVMVCHRWLDIHFALLIPFALCTKSHSCWEDENYGRNSKRTRLQTPEGQLSPNSQLKKQHDGLDLHVTSQSAEQLRASSFKKNAPQMKGSLSGLMMRSMIWSRRDVAERRLWHAGQGSTTPGGYTRFTLYHPEHNLRHWEHNVTQNIRAKNLDV